MDLNNVMHMIIEGTFVVRHIFIIYFGVAIFH